MNKDMIVAKTKLALEMREYIHGVFKKHGVETILCESRANPYYNQVDASSEGFICEYSYGVIDKIYTPLGHLQIASGYFIPNESSKRALEEIERELGINKFKSVTDDFLDNTKELAYITKFNKKGYLLKKNVIDYLEMNM